MCVWGFFSPSHPIHLYRDASARRLSVSPPVGLSVCLLGPGQVVGSRFLPSESLDQLLHPPPEAQLVQRIVAPTCDVRTTWEKRWKNELEKEPELKKCSPFVWLDLELSLESWIFCLKSATPHYLRCENVQNREKPADITFSQTQSHLPANS